MAWSVRGWPPCQTQEHIPSYLQAVPAFVAVVDQVRLDGIRLLIRKGPQGMPSGEVAALEGAGLVRFRAFSAGSQLDAIGNTTSEAEV